MKSLILDINFAKTHVNFNTEFLKAINHHSDIIIVDDNESYGTPQNTNYIYIKSKLIYKFTKNSILSRVFMLVNFVKSYRSVSLIGADKVFYLNHDIVVLFFCLFFVPKKVKKSIYLVHHKHIDELNNNIKLRLFNSYKNQVNHIVLADYIKNHLINDIKVNENFVFTCNHPIYNRHKKISITDSKNPTTFVSLSISSDERIIEEIINNKKLNDVLNDLNIKLYIKSKIYNHETSNLKVFNNFLDENSYNSLYNNCSGVLLLLDKAFEYRISGTMIDALSLGKIIISTNTSCAQFYSKDYPNMVKISYNTDDLIRKLKKNILNEPQLLEDHKRFLINNSLNNLSTQFKYIFHD